MEKIVEFLKGTDAKRFYWNVLAGFLGLVAIYLSGLDYVWAIPLAALINGITKNINK